MSNQATYTKPITKFKRHGMSGTPEYWAWRDIKKRCYNPNVKWYENYGGRGIKMQENWITDFIAFYKDVGPRPGKGYSIDRIDNDGDYTSDNCRWVDKLTQDNNRRSNVWIEHNGEKKTIAQWARHYDVNYLMFMYMVRKRGSSVSAAIKTLRQTSTN